MGNMEVVRGAGIEFDGTARAASAVAATTERLGRPLFLATTFAGEATAGDAVAAVEGKMGG